MNNLYAIIMAGGVGSRFWPQSNINKPKQFLDVLGCGKTLLQQTFDRLARIIPAEHIFVVTVKEYEQLVASQLEQMPAQNIICEPDRNNTAPCVAYAAHKIHLLMPDATLIIVPSDHNIAMDDPYQEALLAAVDFAAHHNAIVTLGIQPTRPDTGYGYIKFQHQHMGISKVERFVEKPSLQKALEYLQEGCYLWNAGIFISSTATLIDAFSKHAPDVNAVFEAATPLLNTPEEHAYMAANYRQCPNISFDYAIAEKADNIFTLPVSCGWSDLGTWNSLHEVADKNSDNIFFKGGYLEYTDTKDCIITLPADKAIVVKGLEGYIIVDTEKALLIYPKDCEQEIKAVTGRIRDRGRLEYL
jgi:mannose-1-phosphate guanylyltransferase